MRVLLLCLYFSNFSAFLLSLILLFGSAKADDPGANSRPFLDVYLRVEPIDDFCGALRCNISYAISVLTTKQNQFDLHSLMLQDGHMIRRTRPRHGQVDYLFEENTVVRLSDELRANRQKVYLGVMFFDIPDDIQDYLVVEVTDVIRLGRRAKTEFSSDTVRIGIQVYRRNEATLDSSISGGGEGNSIISGDDQPGSGEGSGPPASLRTPYRHHHHTHRHNVKECSCIERNCGCCEHVAVRKIHLDDQVCVNVSYISADIGVRLSLSVDTHVYWSKELSIRNPPPACFEVPHLREYASICIRLENLDLKEHELTGCAELEAILLHLRVARHRIGCFRIPL